VQPDAIVHAAAQPSHDLAALRPLDDFDVNATGTLNVIEAARQFTPNAAFVHLSSNKVYGDAPNELPLVELETRWDYARAEDYDGIREDLRIDQSKHSIFGASKVAADVLVQEYGRYYGMKTCCLRGGCLTGPYHSAVELHGFLSYLIKVAVSGGVYKVYGSKGKQVRDNIHSSDVAKFIELYIADPRPAEVYNLGGGRANSCSILEAIALVEAATGRPLASEYVDRHREGDHICYISDLTKMKSHYPGWAIERSLEQMVSEIAAQWLEARTTVS
jgi:CDP-paratose 2-epimerase